MDYRSRTRIRGFHSEGDEESLLHMLSEAIRAGTPHVRQLCQIAATVGDEEMESLAGKADFPFGRNPDLIRWVIEGGFVSGFRVRMWVSECLERNKKFVSPVVQDALAFARDFAEGNRTWQELFGMAQTVESVDVPQVYRGELDGYYAASLRRNPHVYMTYAIAAALSNGNTYMIRALRLSRMAAAATVRSQERLIAIVQQEEMDHQLKLLHKHLRAEAAQWVR
jgi:hypothetical protein